MKHAAKNKGQSNTKGWIYKIATKLDLDEGD